MRFCIPIITLILLIPLLLVSGVQAQPNPDYIVLYAHGYGSAAVLNALAQSNPEREADPSNGLNFRLSPVLGRDLQIHGTLTFNLYLRASGPFLGTVGVQISEVTPDGGRTLVPGAQVDAQVGLNTAIALVTLGVGPIDYKFHASSAILLHVGVVQISGTGRPFLDWDDASAPTSVKLPTIAPTTADIRYIGQHNFGRIFQANPIGTQTITVNATLSDSIGVYRFNSAIIRLTAQNGTRIDTPMNPENTTDYSSTYTITPSFDQGQWQVGLLLHDSTGNDYSFSQPLWVAPFYPVSIVAFGSDGSALQNATLTVAFDTESFWSSVTNRSGWGALTLPSTQVVGPLNLTLAWLGTQSFFPLEVTRPTTLTLQLTVYSTSVSVTLLNIPVPLARVTLYQTEEVQQASTGLDGTAKFRSIPAGDYLVRVDYLLTTYQTSLHVDQNGVMIVPVPFPHPTLTTASIAIIASASVVLLRRKRSKLYPTNFSYFAELTHGGLPEACFTTIAGNSGSGKSVLLNSFAGEHLTLGKSVYITNTEYPDKIRENLIKLGVCTEADLKNGRVIFIDAYSAVGGSPSMEEFSVGSHTDLTNLGLNITKCLEIAGPETDVYLDSLNPLITALRIDYLINFLQSVAAKVKANNGKFCVTVGTGIESEEMTKLEEFSDCVIETQLQESGKGQRRRLRIKKLRDKPYIDSWIRFQVQERRGIVFLTKSKTRSLPA